MTNYEVLKECKVAYEYITDMLENCELLVDEEVATTTKELQDIHELKRALSVLDDLYNRAFEEEQDKDKLKPQKAVHCPHCNKEMYISDLIGYAYLCPSCDENMYSCEGDANYAWWFEDERKF